MTRRCPRREAPGSAQASRDRAREATSLRRRVPTVAPAPDLRNLESQRGALALHARLLVAHVLGEELLRALASFLGARLVDVLGTLGRIGKDRHLVGQDLEEPARNHEHVLGVFVADGHDAIAQRRQQGDVVRQHPEVPFHAGSEHEVSFLAEDATLWRDEFDLELVHAGYSFAGSSAGLAASASGVAVASALGPALL